MVTKISFSGMLFSALLIILVISCELTHPCPECTSPPPDLRLRIMGEKNSDLLYNEIYSPDSIQLYFFDSGIRTNVDIILTADTLHHTAFLYSSEISFKSLAGYHDFYLQLNSADTDSIYLDVQEAHSKCCLYSVLKEFTINSQVPEYDSTEFAYVLRK